jgi:ferredoxin
LSIEIYVDRDLCIGSATCIRLAPGVFALDDDEVATVRDPGAAGADKLRLAAEACPTSAITIAGPTGRSATAR